MTTTTLDAYAELAEEVTAKAREVSGATAGAEFTDAYARIWDAELREIMRTDPGRWGRIRRAAAAYVQYKPDPMLTRRERREQRRQMRQRGH